MRLLRIILLLQIVAGILIPPGLLAASPRMECDQSGKGFGVNEKRCDKECGAQECRPYGDYCRNSSSGAYGARQPVATEEDARRLLQNYFTGRNLTIRIIRERPMVFVAETFDQKGHLVDRVIIHKRSGRIRSIL